MAEPDPLAALRALEQDSTRGAAEIATEARSALSRLAETDVARDAVLGLLAAHPTMAPLVHLADEALRALDRSGPAALAELPRDPSPQQQVAREAAAEIARADTVLTYSRSGTVLAAIDAALDEAGIRVLLSEARPGGEGLATARDLAEAGADVELTYDLALLSRVAEADLVLVGADAITTASFVNKTGTRTLLARAQQVGTPTRVLASTDKLWPSALPREPPVDVQADWTPDVGARIEVQAPLFERVPLGLADRIVTEEGRRDPRAVAEAADAIQVHPAVRETLSP